MSWIDLPFADNLPLIPLVCLVMIFGSALQSAAGFGFGMATIPLLMVLGAESYEAIAILSICGLGQTLYGGWSLREHVKWKRLTWMILLGSATLPLGVWMQHRLTVLEPETVRQIFGGVILSAVILQTWCRIKPRDHVHPFWGVFAVVISGFIAGLAGMGGPPIVLWIMAHRWSNPESRVTMWLYFAGLTPCQLLFLQQRFGSDVSTSMAAGLILIPITLIGIIPGLWIGKRMSKTTLRRAGYIILTMIALYAICQPWVFPSS
ncbi:MAG: sulfite exporter TauE/SafE family protein [Planctomycetes bacterium]|nr:sulfite exporter TauE/SafE family protein [Planctomycetota bacterium]NOG53983.1 sulfite exporter TauE/SafE family protein [Planctomycetota bacterium]